MPKDGAGVSNSTACQTGMLALLTSCSLWVLWTLGIPGSVFPSPTLCAQPLFSCVPHALNMELTSLHFSQIQGFLSKAGLTPGLSDHPRIRAGLLDPLWKV